MYKELSQLKHQLQKENCKTILKLPVIVKYFKMQ